MMSEKVRVEYADGALTSVSVDGEPIPVWLGQPLATSVEREESGFIQWEGPDGLRRVPMRPEVKVTINCACGQVEVQTASVEMVDVSQQAVAANG